MHEIKTCLFTIGQTTTVQVTCGGAPETDVMVWRWGSGILLLCVFWNIWNPLPTGDTA